MITQINPTMCWIVHTEWTAINAKDEQNDINLQLERFAHFFRLLVYLIEGNMHLLVFIAVHTVFMIQHLEGFVYLG